MRSLIELQDVSTSDKPVLDNAHSAAVLQPIPSSTSEYKDIDFAASSIMRTMHEEICAIRKTLSKVKQFVRIDCQPEYHHLSLAHVEVRRLSNIMSFKAEHGLTLYWVVVLLNLTRAHFDRHTSKGIDLEEDMCDACTIFYMRLAI